MTLRHEQYRAFVEAAARAPNDEGYLFEAPRCRFVPEPGDELQAPPGVDLAPSPDGAVVLLPGGARLPVSGIGFEKLRRAFALLPCRLARLTIELGADTPSFVEQTFSRVLFAPAAVAALEAQLPALEIVRFP